MSKSSDKNQATLSQYGNSLRAFMSWKDNKQYPAGRAFTRDEMLEITPDEIANFLNFKAYGKANPSLNDKPTGNGLSSLQFYKKAISAYHPSQDDPWDEVHKKGNPCLSEQVKRTMFRVRKQLQQQVSNDARKPAGGGPRAKANGGRQAGVFPTMARGGAGAPVSRPLPPPPAAAAVAALLRAFETTLDLLTQATVENMYPGSTEEERCYMVPLALKLQFHTMSRWQDVTAIQLTDLAVNHHAGVLKCQIPWAIRKQQGRRQGDEHQDGGAAVDDDVGFAGNGIDSHQLLLGSSDARYCVLLALALHLETFLGTMEGTNAKSIFAVGESEDPKYVQQHMQSILAATVGQQVITPVPFDMASNVIRAGIEQVEQASGGYGIGNLIQQDYIHARGRWLLQTEERDSLSWRDARVAALLCPARPIRYRLKAQGGEGLGDLPAKIVPHMGTSNFLPIDVAMTLALPILWAAMEPTMEGYMPGELRETVRYEYHMWREKQSAEDCLPEDENPVERVPILVGGDEATNQVQILDVKDDAYIPVVGRLDEEARSGNPPAMGGAGGQGSLAGVNPSNVMAAIPDDADMPTLLRANMQLSAALLTEFQSLNAMVRNVVDQTFPAPPPAAYGGGAAAAAYPPHSWAWSAYPAPPGMGDSTVAMDPVPVTVPGADGTTAANQTQPTPVAGENRPPKRPLPTEEVTAGMTRRSKK